MHLKAEKVVCRMYADKKVNSVNELRAKIFWNRLRKKGKVIELALLPPCSATLRKNTARAHYIAKIWRNATESLQCLDSFQYNGWLEDGNIDWIDQMFPDDLEDVYSVRRFTSRRKLGRIWIRWFEWYWRRRWLKSKLIVIDTLFCVFEYFSLNGYSWLAHWLVNQDVPHISYWPAIR